MLWKYERNKLFKLILILLIPNLDTHVFHMVTIRAKETRFFQFHMFSLQFLKFLLIIL
jgi:hypothetical protein